MKTTFFTILFSTFTSLIYSQGYWTQKNDFPGNPRSRGICFLLGGYGYYGSGNHTGGSAESNDFWRYDSNNDSWIQRANLPNGMQAASGSSTSAFGYVGLGWWNSNGHLNYFKYDPITNSWSSIANYIGNITNDGVSVANNGILYSGLGGQPYSGNCWDDWKAYNEATNTWSSLAIFPGVDRRNLVAFVINNEIFAGGGQPEGGSPGNDFYKYSYSTNNWTPISSCPSAYIGSTRNSSFVINNKAYLALDDGLWQYDPSTDTWLSFAMPFNTGVDAAFAINNKGYIIKNGTKQVWEWTPCINTSSTISQSNCNSYIAPDGQVYNNSGTYTAIIPNSTGCDSTITINLTIKNSTSNSIITSACESYTAPDGQIYSASGNYTAIIPNSEGCDSTITIDLTVNQPSSSSISEHSCGIYTAPDGQLYSTSGTYTATIPNQAGCDSTITIDLNVTNIDNSVTVDGLLLSANQLIAGYQWLDCDNGNLEMIGEFNQHFEVTQNGQYAVEISYEGCVDTSQCVLIDYVGLESIIHSNISFYSYYETLNLTYDQLPLNTSVNIFDLQGKIVLNTVLNPKIDISILNNGFYFLQITFNSEVIFKEKFMKYD